MLYWLVNTIDNKSCVAVNQRVAMQEVNKAN